MADYETTEEGLRDLTETIKHVTATLHTLATESKTTDPRFAHVCAMLADVVFLEYHFDTETRLEVNKLRGELAELRLELQKIKGSRSP